jgi:hypothetical protein
MSGVFLSYARSDDEPYVRDLYHHLHAGGFDAWFDREHMPGRSLTFLQEIRDAICQRDRLLVILGPAAVKSDYVRAEWQAALVEGKAVTPILRLGDYDLVPPELQNLHCPDVRATRPVDAAFAEVARLLNEPVPPLGLLLGSIPAVPPHFQPRPDDLSQLARTILYEVEHPVVLEPPQRTTLLHGMGGVGKSVLAAAFARATSTRRVFGDGVIWIALTTTSTPLEAVRSVLIAAGQTVGASIGLGEAVSALRQWLDQRRCLIIVDNAWDVNQVAPLVQAISPVSRLLVTTRDAGIATSLGANSQGVNALSLQAALVQLADWVNLRVEDLPEEARLVAEQCGGLPFALALQGALARDQVSWSDLLDALRDADLTFAKQQLPDYPYPDVLNVIQASVDMLAKSVTDADAAPRFLELGAFFWNEGVATSAIVEFWKSVAGIKEREGRRLLVVLQRKALIRMAGTPPFAYVHDLVADYLAADATRLQGVLLDHYRKQCADGWASGPDDGYFHRHLVDHLAARDDRKQELADLLTASTPEGRNAWFEACDRTGNIDGYRRQLKHLMQAPTAELPEVMTQAVRISSVNAFGGNMPASLAAALVRSGASTLRQAAGFALECHDQKHRAVSLTGLLDQAKDEQRVELIDGALAAIRFFDEFPPNLYPLLDALATDGRTAEALALARRAGHGDGKVGALATVARHLAAEEREAVVDEVIEVCATTIDLFRAAAIELALPLLDLHALLELTGAAIKPLDNVVARGWCEVPVVTRLIELNESAGAWTFAKKVSDTLSRASAMANCVATLPPGEREDAVEDVLTTIAGVDLEAELDQVYESFSHLPNVLSDILPVIMRDQPLLLEPLKGIAPYLNEAQLGRAMVIVEASDDPLFAAQAAATLVPKLSQAVSDKFIKQIVERVEEEPDDERRMTAFSVLISATKDDKHQELLTLAFTSIRSLEESQRLSALKNLAPCLRGVEIDEALAIVGEVRDASQRFDCVDALVPAATPAQLRKARSVATMICDEEEALLAAAALSLNLDPDVRRTLLASAVQQSDYIRARSIALLAPQLDDQSFAKALQAVDQIEDSTSKAEVALPALARRASEPQRKEILKHAIDIAARTTDPEGRVWALEAMIDQFDPELRDYAFTRFNEEAPGMSDDWRAFGEGLFLAVIAPGFPEPKRGELLDQALALVPKLDETALRRDVLSRLAPHLDQERWITATEIVEAENEPYEQAIMAGFLVGNAPKELWPRYVDAALSRIDEIAAGDYPFVDQPADAASARILAYSANPALGLEMTGRFKDQGWKRAALLEFVKATPIDAVDPVLAQVKTLSNPRERASLKLVASRRVGNAQREALIAEALPEALDGPADLLHDDLLPDLARALCDIDIDQLRELWRKHAPVLAERDRRQLLTIVHGLAPMLVKLDLGGPNVVALFDAQRWWP